MSLFFRISVVILSATFFFVVFFLLNLLLRAPTFEANRIAHAGGQYHEMVLTNSLNALTASYSRGYRYFEVDLNYTSDGFLVCAHRWGSKKGNILWPDYTPTRDEYIDAYSESLFTPCVIDSLMNWLSEHGDATLIADVKQNELIALASISEEYPKLRDRIIPQIFQPNDFSKVRSFGFDRVIWALYRFDGENSSILDELKKFSEPIAISVGMQRINNGLLNDLRSSRLDIPVYVHTINDKRLMCILKDTFQVREVFTDTLDPSINCI
uniref:hypothetical protein n=1 Tax=Cellvibrio fontiphilus TaxID=1815559 RepID=UPI002B4BEA04|nr:hypothetical protein [Cellvibrio fontiphilus]